MNTILVTEPKRGYKAKSRIILEYHNNTQLLKLFVPKSLKLMAGETVRINVALPHGVPFLEDSGIVFTDDFRLQNISSECRVHPTYRLYEFQKEIGFPKLVYILPSTPYEGLVVFE